MEGMVRRIALLIAVLCIMAPRAVRAQSQLLLPYNDILFQSTWENPAVRPMHRFSAALLVLPSFELGLINNGFQLNGISEVKDKTLVLDLEKLVDGLKPGRGYQQYLEFQLEILHFRMKWRDWNFWLGMRNITNETFVYNQDMLKLLVNGNGPYVGKSIMLTNAMVDVKNYHEITLGVSKEIGKKWVVGGRVSFLSGLGSGRAVFDKFKIAVSGEPSTLYAHNLEASGQMQMASIDRFMDAEKLKDPKTWFNPKNLGFALAGGVSYKLLPRLNLSLSFSDIGMISWKDSVSGYKLQDTKVDVPTLAEGSLEIFKNMDFSGRAQNKLDSIKGAFLVEKTQSGGYTQWLSPKFHFLATYDLARQTVVGASFSGIYHQKQFYPSATVSFMQGVSDWFQVQVSWSYNQYSALNVGAGIVLCPGPVQLYLLTDNALAFALPQLSRATNLRMGMNLVFGRLNRHHMLTHDRKGCCKKLR